MKAVITAEKLINKACGSENIVNWAYDLKWLDGIEMEKFRDEIKKLVHHRDTTVGLWATDRPDMLTDNSAASGVNVSDNILKQNK